MEAQHPLSCLETHFSCVTDPRTGNRKTYSLIDIIGVTIVGVLCGCDDFTTIEFFAKLRLKELREFLPLPNGIPSHDTLGRCFALMDAEEVEQGFASWISTLYELGSGEVVAIDGKTLRGSYDQVDNKYAIHMVSAFAVANGLCLGQRKVDEKSNEITAIPKLLEILDLEGCVVTIDAMGTQRSIANQIIDAGADYVLALKANHSELYTEVVKTFDHLEGSQVPFSAKQWDAGHGRIESRQCCVIDVEHPDFDWILPQDLEPWKNISSIIRVRSERTKGEGHSTQDRYFISSLKAKDNDPKRFNEIIRSHWAVENNLHWTLDVIFNEDKSRVRKGNADQNLSIVRRLTLNLLKKDSSLKASIKQKRLKASVDTAYLIGLFNSAV